MCFDIERWTIIPWLPAHTHNCYLYSPHLYLYLYHHARSDDPFLTSSHPILHLPPSHSPPPTSGSYDVLSILILALALPSAPPHLRLHAKLPSLPPADRDAHVPASGLSVWARRPMRVHVHRGMRAAVRVGAVTCNMCVSLLWYVM
jgi:hypothetical protein